LLVLESFWMDTLCIVLCSAINLKYSLLCWRNANYWLHHIVFCTEHDKIKCVSFVVTLVVVLGTPE